MAFGRPRRESAPDEGIVFEEVPDIKATGGKERVADFTYREDPVETGVRKILGLEQKVAQAQQEASRGKGGRGSVEIAKVLLAEAKYKQASLNERLGRSKNGEADRLLQEWQKSQDALDNVRDEEIRGSRDKALSFYSSSTSIDAETAAQLRRHPLQ
jgi:hypothetical protein